MAKKKHKKWTATKPAVIAEPAVVVEQAMRPAAQPDPMMKIPTWPFRVFRPR